MISAGTDRPLKERQSTRKTRDPQGGLQASLTDLLTGARLFVDETTAKVLAPGTGKVKTGYLWAIARDDGAHGGTDPPAVVYTYMPGRGKVWAERWTPRKTSGV